VPQYWRLGQQVIERVWPVQVEAQVGEQVEESCRHK
jgi:hypothetical protein